MNYGRLFACGWILAVLLVGRGTALGDEKSAWSKSPSSVAELRNLEQRVKETTKRVIPAVVGVQVGGASGSGVIVNKEGYVLTAGHVSGQPNRDCVLIFPDGRQVKGKTLGANRGIDAGMIKITEEGTWPYVTVGDSKNLQKGQWLIALGHPGGFQRERTPVLRVGRVLNATENYVQTDCTLVGGDSGGPLFDLDGNVVGIHSRIGASIAFNIHVPVDTFTDTWERLASGEAWGNMFGGNTPPRPTGVPNTGLSFQKVSDMMKITEVEKGSPGEKAGLKPRDLLTKLDGQKVTDRDEIDKILRKRKAGDEITIEVMRAGEPLTLKLVLDKPKN